mgnify:CR=1 FL=1
MTDSRLAGTYTEALTDATPARRLAGGLVEALLHTAPAESRTAGVFVEVLAPAQSRGMSRILAEVLTPRPKPDGVLWGQIIGPA